MPLTKIDRYVLNRIEKLRKDKRIPKTELGQIISDNKKESPQQRYLRAQRLLEGKATLKISRLAKISEFFQVPISYFFPPELTQPYVLKSGKQPTKSNLNSLEQIAESLRKLNFDEDFIKNEIRQLKALEAYQKSEEN